MPLVLKKMIGAATLALWEIRESEEELRAVVAPEDRASADRFANPSRRVQHLAWRAALRTLAPGVGISYDPTTGAPVADESGLFISASHTGRAAAALVSPHRCAVDIEDAGRDFSRAARRFVSPAEAGLDDGDPLFLPAVWCSKEAMYKYAAATQLDLLADIVITEADIRAGKVVGKIKGGSPVTANLVVHDRLLLSVIA